jgi:hypothetical protein
LRAAGVFNYKKHRISPPKSNQDTERTRPNLHDQMPNLLKFGEVFVRLQTHRFSSFLFLQNTSIREESNVILVQKRKEREVRNGKTNKNKKETKSNMQGTSKP